jgi:hypothetical protein
LYNQAATLALDFDAGQVAPTLEPTVDDQLVRNDVTAKRRDGGERQAVDEDGPLGVDTIGRYDTNVTVNVPSDPALAGQASWRLHLGTLDADRWPRVAVDLDAAPALADDVDDVRPGDLITLDNLPEHISAAGTASLMVQGWAETIGSHRRVVTFTCTPAEAFEVAEFGADVGTGPDRFESAGSELAEAIDDDDAAFDVDVDGPLWTTDDDETPFDVLIGGELVTVTDIAGASSPQTFTVTRSVNGIVKSHAIGASVRLARTPRFAL